MIRYTILIPTKPPRGWARNDWAVEAELIRKFGGYTRGRKTRGAYTRDGGRVVHDVCIPYWVAVNETTPGDPPMELLEFCQRWAKLLDQDSIYLERGGQVAFVRPHPRLEKDNDNEVSASSAR